MPTTLLRPKVVIPRSGGSRSTFYSWIREGLWPPLIKLGPRSSAQPDYEVEAMLQARVAGKTDDEIRALVRSLLAERQQTRDDAERA